MGSDEQRRQFRRAGFPSARSERLIPALPRLYSLVSAANATLQDGDLATDAQLPYPPTGDVLVKVNGLEVEVGAGCYFEGARLFWRGSLAGFELDGADVISFTYEV